MRIALAIAIAAFLSALLLASAAAATARAVAPAWGQMGGIGVGMLQQAVIYHYGLGVRDSCTEKNCVDVRYYGPVQVEFKSGRVIEVNCAAPGSLAGKGCPSGFALPDGVRLGTVIPFRTRWNGYRRYQPDAGQADFFSWKKFVTVHGRRVGIYLTTEKSKVVGIVEAAA